MKHRAVILMDPDGVNMITRTVTDASGNFSLTVPAGSYLLKGDGDEWPITITPGARIRRDLYHRLK
jgi:hypothetical protein